MEYHMRKITNITSAGVTYTDEEGNEQFIDFEVCLQNYIKTHEKYLGDRVTDEDREFWQKAKYVGVRYALSTPPSVAFYLIPPIHFEFLTREGLDEILIGIKRAGWRTNDGE
jgi:hypothetical protein